MLPHRWAHNIDAQGCGDLTARLDILTGRWGHLWESYGMVVPGFPGPAKT